MLFFILIGADSGNRTRALCLENRYTAIILHPLESRTRIELVSLRWQRSILPLNQQDLAPKTGFGPVIIALTGRCIAVMLLGISSGDRNCTDSLLVMSQTSCYYSTPRHGCECWDLHPDRFLMRELCCYYTTSHYKLRIFLREINVRIR